MTIEELEDKHVNIVTDYNWKPIYSTKQHTQLSIQFAIDCLEELKPDFCMECYNAEKIGKKIEQLKKELQ
jgi:hypothetical protein